MLLICLYKVLPASELLRAGSNTMVVGAIAVPGLTSCIRIKK